MHLTLHCNACLPVSCPIPGATADPWPPSGPPHTARPQRAPLQGEKVTFTLQSGLQTIAKTGKIHILTYIFL